MAIKYSKAPISELSLGIFFKSNVLMRNNVLFDFILKLSNEYPIVQTTPALVSEEILDGNISQSMDTINSGFIAHWLISKDAIYKICLEQNKMTFHWGRRDDMPSVSEYPGYQHIYQKFNILFQTMVEIASERKVDVISEIRLYSLYYQDRINLEIYKAMDMKLTDIVKFSVPSINFDDKNYAAENYVGKYTINLPYLEGYSIISVNTPTFPGIGQALILDNRIKGFSGNLRNWFDLAHQSQLSFFENIFNETILKDWL